MSVAVNAHAHAHLAPLLLTPPPLLAHFSIYWRQTISPLSAAAAATQSLCRCARKLPPPLLLLLLLLPQVLLLHVPPLIPQLEGGPFADIGHLQQLAEDLQAFSLNTYDYTVSELSGAPGPNSPLPWARANAQRALSALEPKSSADGRGRTCTCACAVCRRLLAF